MMYAIVTSDNDFSVSVMELYGTSRLGKNSGTLWNFLTCVMEPNNYGKRGPILHRFGDIAGFFAPHPFSPLFLGCSR